MQRKLKANLGEIFAILDGTGDGYISEKNINIEGLSLEVGNVLTPIFYELYDLPNGAKID